MYQIFTENIQEGDEYPYERKSLKLTKLPFTLSHEKQSNLFKIFLHLINIERDPIKMLPHHHHRQQVNPYNKASILQHKSTYERDNN